MMTEDFDRILDECIDRINRGDSLADCLSDYPAYSDSSPACTLGDSCSISPGYRRYSGDTTYTQPANTGTQP